MEKKRLGILGCGDFLRWQAGDLTKSKGVEVVKLFDPDASRAAGYAEQLGGEAVADEEAIFSDPDIDIVCLFVPPWIRRGQVERAAAAGKHIITTKPLAPNTNDADAIVAAVAAAGVRCAVLYGRSGDSATATLKRTFDDGRFGRLALYRRDWLHHYPQWNKWALDPARNGGPFMDAMIHNLNAARHLMGRPVTKATLFSDKLAHPDLMCADTEAMKVDFDEGGAAYLFITWAADLEVMDTVGNNREHIDIYYLVTDQGWRITEGQQDGKAGFFASREGKQEFVPVEPLPATTFDRFVGAIADGAQNPGDMPTVENAAEDIRLVVNS